MAGYVIASFRGCNRSREIILSFAKSGSLWKRYLPHVAWPCSHRLYYSSSAYLRTNPSVRANEENDLDKAFVADPFMQEQIENYEKGKRWLARMMGSEPEAFTQKDIEDAICYLLPSNLWAKDARPAMRHPFEVFPNRKQEMVDRAGRPFAAAFYTGRPNYFDLTFTVWDMMHSMNKADSDGSSVGVHSLTLVFGSAIDPESPTSDALEVGRESTVRRLQWITKLQLECKLRERLSDKQYGEILFRFKRLAAHKHANLAQGLLEHYQVPVETPGKVDLMEVEYVDGVARAMGYRKTAIADVFVRKGSGKYTVNGVDIGDFFSTQNDLEQLMFPLVIVGELTGLDIEAYVTGGGTSGKSGAIRLAVSKAIAALCPHHYEALDSAGLLIRDYRQVERKKPGRRKARRKFQWVKR